MSSPESKRKKKDLKRTDNLSWEDFYMGIALLAAQRSKDPDRQVGACIVNADKYIVGIGYNGMPKGLDELSWGKNTPNPLDNKQLYVCHAEMNAVMNQPMSSKTGCKIYVTLFPCNECAKIIIQAGIIEVIYLSNEKKDKDIYKASKFMLETAEVKVTQFIPKTNEITIQLRLPPSSTSVQISSDLDTIV